MLDVAKLLFCILPAHDICCRNIAVSEDARILDNIAFFYLVPFLLIIEYTLWRIQPHFAALTYTVYMIIQLPLTLMLKGLITAEETQQQVAQSRIVNFTH